MLHNKVLNIHFPTTLFIRIYLISVLFLSYMCPTVSRTFDIFREEEQMATSSPKLSEQSATKNEANI